MLLDATVMTIPLTMIWLTMNSYAIDNGSVSHGKILNYSFWTLASVNTHMWRVVSLAEVATMMLVAAILFKTLEKSVLKCAGELLDLEKKRYNCKSV